jgi:CheY-like chemotaxis protein
MHRILIVDDDREFASILGDLLEPTDCQLIFAEDGEQGVTAALAGNPDLIVMDLGLPKVDGIEAIRQLREHESMAKVPILLCSGLGDDAEKIRLAQEAGCTGHVLKSRIPDVLDCIENLLAENGDV